MDEKLLEQYAKFAVTTGSNLQKGQTMIIASPVENADFALLCAKAAYDAGAREVVVHYNDEKLSRLKLERTDIEVLEDVKPWMLSRNMEYYQGEGSVCRLAIYAEDPEIYKGLDTKKISQAQRAVSNLLQPWRELSMSNKVQWCVVSVPCKAWAAKVFPNLDTNQAMEKLWEVIFKICRVDGGDPVAAWKEHVARGNKNMDWLNSLDLESLHLQSSNGTNLVVGLAEDHIWAGFEDHSTTGVPFLANIPTEEVFTAPHREKTNGVVKSSMPYVYGGNLIEGISVRFENGVVVEHSATKGEEILKELLDSDEGGRRLGEIALVPASSPIRQSGLLFYNTLFDENAACHIAFGAGYPFTVKNGSALSREDLLAKGVNDSVVHEDIMIGTKDMQITGRCKDGREVTIFTDGEWADR